MRRGVVNKFNRGEVDPRALDREDVERVTNSCELMENFMPIRLGPMQMRPGTCYLGDMNAATSHMVPFVASMTDKFILELGTTALRVWYNDALVTRPTSTLTITNGNFTSNITGWTDDSGTGSSTGWVTGGYAHLTGNGSTRAKLYQTFGGSVSETGVRITVVEAPVELKIGTSGVDSDDILNTVLEPGVHSFSIDPGSLPTFTFANSKEYRTLLDAVVIEANGTLSIPVTVTDPTSCRVDQSADVMFVTQTGGEFFKIVRRGDESWSVTDYRADDGPFGLVNNTDITLTAAALDGNTTLTSNEDYFSSDNVGQLFKLTSAGQAVSASVSAADNGTNSIRVTGVGASRRFTVSRTGTWSATVTLQRSTDDATWEDVENYVINGSKTYDDELDNQILYYRLWVKPGDYTSGTANLDLNYTGGSIDGIARVTSITSATVAAVQVLVPFGSTTATRDWYAGEWSPGKGYPSSVALYEGRLWMAGKTRLWGSVSDAYQSFDSEIEGDSAPIRRTIGFGPVDDVEWLTPSSRLIMGLASDEVSVRSSSFGEVLTNTNINLKSGSTNGVAAVEPLKVDNSILYVQRSGIKILDLQYNLDSDNHEAQDLMMLHPDICEDGIKRIAVSRQPETRVYVVLDTGEMRVYLMDPAEGVKSWSRITTPTGDLFKDVVVLPGEVEDDVYVHVERAGGNYLEKFYRLRQYVGFFLDSCQGYSSPGTTITGLDHLNGETVTVFADAELQGTYVVSSGQITVPSSWVYVVVGLAYMAKYQSCKVGKYITGSVAGKRKRVVDLHLAMTEYIAGTIQVGPTFTELEDMPLIERGAAVTQDIFSYDYDELPFEFNGNDDVDPRICIQATGPCTITALTYGVLQSGDTGESEG